MAKLTVRNGVLYLGEEICREVGFNVSAILAHWPWYSQTDNLYIEQVDVLAAAGVKLIRANGMPNAAGTSGGSGHWDTWGIPAGPLSGNAYTDLHSTIYTRQRQVLDYCESKGVSVIVTLMGRMPTLADVKGETQSVGFGTAGSATRTFARTIFAAYVNALKDHNAIAAWEINNEWNNYAELNTIPSDGAGSGSPSLGAPTYTDPADKVTMAQFVETMVELATVVKTADPSRAVLSGNAGCWNSNNHGMEGYSKFLARINPDPIDTISFHQYSVPSNQEKFDNGFDGLLSAMQQCKVASRAARKPLIIGEIGVPESLATKGKDWGFISELIRDPQAPQVMLLWDLNKPGSTYPSPTPDWTIWPTNSRAYMYEAVREVQSKRVKYNTAARRRGETLPVEFIRFPGTSCIWRTLPIAFSSDWTLGFWGRYWDTRDPNFGRVISTTSNESSNGFTMPDLTGGSGNSATGEPYFRLYNASGGQSVTSRLGYMDYTRWKHFVYSFETASMYYHAFFNGFRSASRFPSGSETPYTGTWVAPAGDFVVGANYSKAAGYWKGDMADLFIIPRKIDEDEVYRIYAYGEYPADTMKLFASGLDGWTVVGTPSVRTDEARRMRSA